MDTDCGLRFPSFTFSSSSDIQHHQTTKRPMAPPKQFSLIIPQYKVAALTSGFSYAQFIENVFHANKRQLKHVNRDEVDRVWKEMVPKWIPHDERRCQKLIAEVESAPSRLGNTPYSAGVTDFSNPVIGLVKHVGRYMAQVLPETGKYSATGCFRPNLTCGN
jgi:hypothetical protein